METELLGRVPATLRRIVADPVMAERVAEIDANDPFGTGQTGYDILLRPGWVAGNGDHAILSEDARSAALMLRTVHACDCRECTVRAEEGEEGGAR